MDDLRAPGTVEVECSAHGCRSHFWVECLHPLLPDGPFSCPAHDPDVDPAAGKVVVSEAVLARLPRRSGEIPPVNDFGVRLPPGTKRIDCAHPGCRFVGAIDVAEPTPDRFLCPAHEG